MRFISRWANRHRHLAILLLIGCEVANAVNGLLLGANILANSPGGLLLLLTLVLLGFGIWVRWWAENNPPRSYAASRWQLAGAFGSTYLLFVLLGGQWGQSVSHPTGGQGQAGLRSVAFGSSERVVAGDTLIRPGAPTAGLSATGVVQADPAPASQAGTRFGYVMLLLLGLVLLFFSFGLACGLACSRQGFLALLALMGGLGAGAGGIFFAARSKDRPIKRWRDMPSSDRKRVMRRFWRGILILFGIIGLYMLLGRI
ncbi:hypothetical protein [Fibrella aquatilis]|uniref:Uncharacterized protein n=1 Tax=Fibrella aquatilis TaxID=2817059 RepID=A0A939G6Z5_9BACT|nr:hypothetical protein [Fibrella aquatilis]MBO0933016.1 hypothetical protein [Fibrella aquatilis]